MPLREMLLKEFSDAQANKIIKWVGKSQLRFDQLVKLFLSGEYRVVQRAAWPVTYIAINSPQLIKKHLAKLINNLEKPNLQIAVKRNTLRFLEEIPIPKKFHGQLMNRCFTYILDPAEPPAIKAFALTILQHLSKLYPEIKPELKVTIEERWEYEKPSFHSRGRKILKEM